MGRLIRAMVIAMAFLQVHKLENWAKQAKAP